MVHPRLGLPSPTLEILVPNDSIGDTAHSEGHDFADLPTWVPLEGDPAKNNWTAVESDVSFFGEGRTC
jgi:hypothetical protein